MNGLLETVVSLTFFCAWQAVCYWACWRVIPARADASERLAFLCGFDIVLNSLAAAILTFPGLNSRPAYAVVAALLVAVAAARPHPAPLCVGFPRALALMLAGLFCFGLFLAVRPIDDVDSLYNVHFVLDWAANRATPLVYTLNYSPFWELGYVPQLVLAKSDLLLWFVSLKPVALLALLLWRVARELKLPPALAAWIVASALVFRYLWTGYSGVGTLKNDMAVAAGQAIVALLAIRLARRALSRSDAAFLALAVAFLSAKSTGPVFLVAAGGIVALATHRWWRANPRPALALAAVCAASWLCTSGPYYLRNLFAYGNPFYPFALNAGFIHLPGNADLSYTSILYNAANPELWRTFFLPARGLSPAGILFPLVLAAVLLLAPLTLLWTAWRAFRGRPYPDVALAVALTQTVSWLIYFRSIYTAGTETDALRFIVNGLGSLRFVEGTLAVAEIVLIAVLAYCRAPRTLLYGLLAIQLASRFWLLTAPESRATIGFAALGALAAVAVLVALRRAPRLAVACAVAWFGVWSVVCIERRRPEWLKEYQPLYLPLRNEPAAVVHLPVDDLFAGEIHLALMGRHFQHSIVAAPLSELPATPPPDYMVWIHVPGLAPPPVPDGFTTVADVPTGILWKRR